MLSRLFAMVIFVSASVAARADDVLTVPARTAKVLAQRCIDCHGADSDEGDVRLDTLAKLGIGERLDLLNKVQEQMFLKQMPPEDEEQPTAAEQARLADWVSQELHKHNASKLEAKLQKPLYGNYVDHETLFSGEFKDLPGFTYDRR